MVILNDMFRISHQEMLNLITDNVASFKILDRNEVQVLVMVKGIKTGDYKLQMPAEDFRSLTDERDRIKANMDANGTGYFAKSDDQTLASGLLARAKELGMDGAE